MVCDYFVVFSFKLIWKMGFKWQVRFSVMIKKLFPSQYHTSESYVIDRCNFDYVINRLITYPHFMARDSIH